MAQATNLLIAPPLAGINRRVGYQNQPPYSCWDSRNYWPLDVRSGRSISGTRPPLVAFTPPPGDGPVNCVCRVNGAVPGKPFQSMVAARDGHLYWWNASNQWEAATGEKADALATDIPLYAATYLQKVYIPNPGGKPLVFDYTTGTCADMVESEGTVPDDLRMFAVWQGALWGAGTLDSPHVLYASKRGDAHGWNFAANANDLSRAFFTGGEREGRLRGPITAIVFRSDATMLISTVEGLAILDNHPNDNGGFFSAGGSDHYILGQGAWCKGPDSSLFYLTRNGLYYLQNGSVASTQVSKNVIPEELVGLAYDYENPTVSMAYEPRWNLIYITVRGNVGQKQAWAYDLTAGGFHRMEFDSYPHVLCKFDPIETIDHSAVLFGGSGYGGLARFDRFGVEDFASSITIGPVAISPDAGHTAKIVKATVTLGGDAPIGDDQFQTIPPHPDDDPPVERQLPLGGGKLEIFVGANGEDCINRVLGNLPTFTQSCANLQTNNGNCHPNASGAAVAFRFSANSGHNALEEINLTLTAQGVNRMTLFKNMTFSLACHGYVTATPNLGPLAAPATTRFEYSLATQSHGTAVKAPGPINLFDLDARAGSQADGAAGSLLSLVFNLVDGSPDSAVWDSTFSTLTVTLDISGGANTVQDLVNVVNATSPEWIASNVVEPTLSLEAGENFCEAFMDGGEGPEFAWAIDVRSAAFNSALNGKTLSFAEVTDQGEPTAALDMSGNIIVSIDDTEPTPIEQVTAALNTIPSIVAVTFTETDYVPGDHAGATATLTGGVDPTNLADGLEIINAARFPQEWWDFCNEDGSNVRVANEQNEFLPFDLLGFDATKTEGSIVVRRPLPAEPTPVRCYICRSNTAKFPLGSLFGQFNAYPPWMLAIWPGGWGRNRLPAAWELGPFADESHENPFSPTNPGGQGEGSPEDCDPPEGSAVAMGVVRFPENDKHMLFLGSEETHRCANPAFNPGNEQNPSVCFIASSVIETFTGHEIAFGFARQTSGSLDGTDNTELEIFEFDKDVTENFVPFVRTLGGGGNFVLDVDNQTVVNGGGLTGNRHDYFVWNDAASNMDKGDIATLLDTSLDSLGNAEVLCPTIATDAYEVDVLRHLTAMLSPIGLTEQPDDALEEKNLAQEQYWGDFTWIDDPGPPHEPA